MLTLNAVNNALDSAGFQDLQLRRMDKHPFWFEMVIPSKRKHAWIVASNINDLTIEQWCETAMNFIALSGDENENQ